jgi:fucose permease
MEGSFVRTSRTWVAYLSLGYYGYLLNALGPALPFLRTDLHLSYAESGLHTSAFALGMLVAGLAGDRVTRKLGRRRALAWGLGGLAAGSLLLVIGRSFAVTLGGAFLMGSLGTLVLVLVPAVLADQHGALRAVAFSEANVVSTTCSMLAPLFVGALARTAFGWRAALLLGALMLVPLVIRLRGLSMPSTSETGNIRAAANRLPLGYWAYWLVIVCCVSLEFCMVFWTADFLHSVARVPAAAASALVSVFLAAMLVGRIAGSRLTRAYAAERLLLPALGIVAAGFPLYWLVSVTPIRIVGLFLTGLGIANLYPLTLALAIGTSPRASGAASARATLASATAIGVAPLVLGWLADHTGIDRAYGVIVVLLVLALLTSQLARRVLPADSSLARSILERPIAS